MIVSVVSRNERAYCVDFEIYDFKLQMYDLLYITNKYQKHFNKSK